MSNCAALFLAATILLAGCGSPEPRPAETPLPTVSQWATPAFTPPPTLVLPSHTPTPTATALPTTQPSPTPDPLTHTLTTSLPTDLEILQFTFARHPLPLGTLATQFRQELAAGEYTDFTRQDADVDGDGQSEILISGSIYDLYLYVTILGHVDDAWHERLYTEAWAKYCAAARVAVEADRVVADFLSCTGGTGVLDLTWEQRWIRCEGEACTVVWSATLLWTRRLVNWTVAREYTVAEIEQPDPETIHLTTRRFGVTDLPPEQTGAPPGTARRLTGPDALEVFRWDGDTYRLESYEQIAPGIAIAHEFDLLTQQTINLIYESLSQPPDGESFEAAWADFWGLPASDEPEDPAWGPWYRGPDAAAHNGDLETLGEWIAGFVGANDRPLCRLTVQRRTAAGFALEGRVELPCTANLTHLAWADVTGDGNDELLLLTIPPDIESQETGAGMQRLHVYAVGAGLTEIATLDGDLNGPDGAGIRWEDLNNDGVIEVLVGLPLTGLENRSWPDLTRRFQVHRWNANAGGFVPDAIRTYPLW